MKATANEVPHLVVFLKHVRYSFYLFSKTYTFKEISQTIFFAETEKGVTLVKNYLFQVHSANKTQIMVPSNNVTIMILQS